MRPPLVVLPDRIVVRPNDRVIRSVGICVAIVWWIGTVMMEVMGNPPVVSCASLVLFVPLLPLAWFLAWVTTGRWVFQASEGALTRDRCLGAFCYWRTSYPIAAIRAFRAKEDRRRIKGALSVRYSVLMDAANGTTELAWFRDRAEAETLAAQLPDLAQHCVAPAPSPAV